MPWTAPTTFVAGAVLTAAQLNTNVRDNSLALPRGYMAFTTLATSFSSTSTTAVDVTGLSVTFTAEAGRRYLIQLVASAQNSGANTTQIYITTSGNTALAEGFTQKIASATTTISTFTVQTPAAGSVTYKVRGNATAGTWDVYGTNTRAELASRLLVTDIGLA